MHRPSRRLDSIALWAVLSFTSLCLANLPATETGSPPSFPLLSFELISRTDGLSNQAVSSIVQDSSGYLWFGTQNGLDRYDGLGFTVFEHDSFDANSISHNLVQTLFMDQDDTLWIGTYSGLNRLDTHTGRFVRYIHDPKNNDSLSNNIVVSIFRDRDHRLWVGTLDGLNLLDESTGRFKRYMADGNPGSLRHKIIRCMVQDQAGRFWVGTGGGGLHLYQPQTDSFTALTHDPARPDSLPSDSVMCMDFAPDGSLWLGCWGGGIARMDSPDGRFTTVDLADERIYCLLARDEQYVYAGTWGGGLFLLDRATGQTARYVNEAANLRSLSHNTVYSLFKDPGGILWVGTNGGGLNKFNFRRTRYQSELGRPDTPGALGKGKVTAILEDSQRRLWIGTYNGGVFMKPSGAAAYQAFRHDDARPDSLSNDVVTRIYEDREGTIWILTTHGLNRWRPGTASFIHYLPGSGPAPEIPDDIVYDMIQTADGTYWIATYNKGVAHWDPEDNSWELFSYDPDTGFGLSDNLVYSLMLDQTGMIWVCTNGGLSRIDPINRTIRNWVHNQANTTSLSFNTIRMIMQDSKGRYWIATSGGGLDRYVPGTDIFVHRTKKDGLSHNTINTIQEDQLGNLWLGTQEGLCVYNPDSDTFLTYTDENGLQDIEFSNGYGRTHDNVLLFGGPKGYSRIANFDLLPQGPVPKIQIGSFQVYNQPRNTLFPASDMGAVVLAPEDNYFSFTFTVMDFAKPHKNSYAWMLEGFDKDWIYSTSRNHSSYTNIPPGHYVFRVKGANAAGVWNQEGKQIDVVVETPLYLRWWAILLYILAAGALAFMLVRLRTAWALRQKVAELQQLKTRLETANSQLEFLSTHDQLTGIANRRALDRRLQENWVLCQRHGISLGIIMVDVDLFKPYNDQHGHMAGDQVLKAIATILNRCMKRNSDLVGRYGGEEFMILLPGSEASGASQVAEELRLAVQAACLSRATPLSADCQIPEKPAAAAAVTQAADTAGCQDLAAPNAHGCGIITISAGVACLVPRAGATPEQLVQAADTALYHAKAAGRNRVGLQTVE